MKTFLVIALVIYGSAIYLALLPSLDNQSHLKQVTVETQNEKLNDPTKPTEQEHELER